MEPLVQSNARTIQPSTIEYEQPSNTEGQGAKSNFKRKHEAAIAGVIDGCDDVNDGLSDIVKMLHKSGAMQAAQTVLVGNLRADAGRHQHDQTLRTSLLEVASLYTLNGLLARQRISEVVAIAVKGAIDAGKLTMVQQNKAKKK
jgi:hypothetical protein